MKRQLTVLPKDHEMTDQHFSQLLKEAEKHTLRRSDFFYITENKKKQRSEKRIGPEAACELLLRKTALKHFCLCTHAKVGYMFHSKGIYGSFSQLEIKIFLKRILEKVGEERLLKPYFINELLKWLKSSRIAVNGPIMLMKCSDEEER